MWKQDYVDGPGRLLGVSDKFQLGWYTVRSPKKLHERIPIVRM